MIAPFLFPLYEFQKVLYNKQHNHGKGGFRMQCVKCGRDSAGEQIFCESCLSGMEQYPVKPGTPVNLPKHYADQLPKRTSHRKRPLTPDEQILYLRKHLRRARIFSMILALLLCAATALLAWDILAANDNKIGWNYTIDITQGND